MMAFNKYIGCVLRAMAGLVVPVFELYFRDWPNKYPRLSIILISLTAAVFAAGVLTRHDFLFADSSLASDRVQSATGVLKNIDRIGRTSSYFLYVEIDGKKEKYFSPIGVKDMGRFRALIGREVLVEWHLDYRQGPDPWGKVFYLVGLKHGNEIIRRRADGLTSYEFAVASAYMMLYMFAFMAALNVFLPVLLIK